MVMAAAALSKILLQWEYGLFIIASVTLTLSF